MTALAAVALMFVSCSAAASVILALPVAVAAESLHACSPATARRFWIIVNILPPAAGCLLTAAGFLYHLSTDITATPHLERVRPHLCLTRIIAMPDAPFRFQLYALFAACLLAYALAHFVSSYVASRRAEAIARRLAALAGSVDQTSEWQDHGPASGVVGASSSPSLPGGERPARTTPEGQLEPPPAPPVLLVVSEEPDCFSLGLSAPVIILTSGLPRALAEAETAAVIAHERCHVLHRDNLVDLFMRLATDALIWLPTTHYYLGALRSAMEQACDETAANATSADTVVSALGKIASHKRARQLKLQGDLAQLKPTFPVYANPEARIAALSGRYASLALPLPVIVTIEAVLLLAAAIWLGRPIHDTLFCATQSLLKVLQM